MKIPKNWRRIEKGQKVLVGDKFKDPWIKDDKWERSGNWNCDFKVGYNRFIYIRRIKRRK